MVGIALMMGCSEDEAGSVANGEDEACPVESCSPCDDDGDCPSWADCDDDEGLCIPEACSGDADCGEEGDCGDGGYCEAGGQDGCGAGEEACGDACCGSDEVCESRDICDDGSCETVHECRPECQGNLCGVDGEVCCEGELSECGPEGQCAPDCSGTGGLCGEAFDECCEVGEACLFGECRTMGDECDDPTGCGFGEYCDEGLGRCMPDDYSGDIQCTMDGDFETFEIEEKWAWDEENVTVVPLVGDVTGDGEPNVVFNTFGSDIVILDKAGNEEGRIVHNPSGEGTYGAHWRSNMALGDVTGDGILEIIYVTEIFAGGSGCCQGDAYIAAATGGGDHLWLAHDEDGTPVQQTFNTGAIGVANFDGDTSRAQVMAGAMLIDHDGLIMWNEDGEGSQFGSSGGYTGGLSIAVDLLGDGKQEIVTGRHAWTVDWPEGASGPEDVEVELLWENTDGPDGYPAVADMDGNGHPEVVLFAGETLRIIDGQSGKLWCGIDPTGDACESDDSLRTQPVADPSGGGSRGGPPTVADFDGDGRPEVGAAGRDYYTVFDIYRPGFGDDDTPEEIDEDLLDEFGQDMPEPGEIYIRWFIETQDSSRATGSSVFDFQGDGSASVVYNDECYLRVLDGSTGEFELEIMNSTGTRIEYPIVVDVDGNGRSEIVVVANDQNRNCSQWYGDPDYQERRGVYVYEDPNELWVHTRSIWNQHAYSIDNINDDGTLPEVIPDWWDDHNTFRANRQGQVPLNAPDVVVSSVEVNAQFCPPTIDFQATVRNEGLSTIPAGMPVSLYQLDSAGGGTLVETVVLEEAIPPGSVQVVDLEYEAQDTDFNVARDYQVVANDDDEEPVRDCNPETAAMVVEGITCMIPL